MKKCGNWPIGLCSWSLQTDTEGVANAMSKLHIEHVHLALAPALEDRNSDLAAAVRTYGWNITSTMINFPQEDYSTLEAIKITGGIIPDASWESNCQLTMNAIDLTADLEVEYLSMHAGFIDHEDKDGYHKFFNRMRSIADAASDRGIIILLETGQETAKDLRHFLEEISHPSIGVNFDPANMILYGKGDPIEAVRILAPWIKHVHIKDALKSDAPGAWGSEVPWGSGQVGEDAFLSVLTETGFDGALAIEREAGNKRFADIQFAAERLSQHGA